MSSVIDDFFNSEEQIEETNKKNRAYCRDKKEVKKKRSLAISEYAFWAVWGNYGYEDGDFIRLNQYIQQPHHSTHKVFLKKVNNKKIRRNKQKINNGKHYKRFNEYWWELY